MKKWNIGISEKAKKKVKIAFVSALAISMFAMTGCGNADNRSSAGSDTKSGSGSTSGTITVVSREDGSGTRGAFIELFGVETKDADGNKTDNTTTEAVIANKTDVMMTNVAQDPQAIGYISLGSLNDTVKAVKIDGAEATAENVSKGTYKVSRPFNIATKDKVNDQTQDFINFIMSKEGQDVVGQSYIKIDENAKEYTSNGASGKVVVSGSSSVSPIMEKLIEAYKDKNKDVTVELNTSDSTAGMKNTMEGTCDIGMASRELKDEEVKELKATQIAIDGIAVVVNKNNSVDALTTDQVKDIYTGKIKDWSEVK